MRKSIPISLGILGAIGGILLGIPSYTADYNTRSKPPFFDVYCTDTSYWIGECSMSPGGIIGMAFAGAAILGVIGLVVAYALKTRDGPATFENSRK